jgi:hypothetical protein
LRAPWVFAVVGLVGSTIQMPAAAQSPEPSARRIYLLCQMEDPSCASLIQKAYDDFLANPTATACFGVNFPGSVYDERRQCWNVTATCHFVREPTLSLQEVYRAYMSFFSQTSYLSSSPRLIMYETMNRLGRCGSITTGAPR